MVFVILCGGLGTRMTQGTYPKPLTPILGRPSLWFTLKSLIPLVEELIFIYGPHLARYNFEEVVSNLFPTTKCTFCCIPYGTRGAAETALVGVIALDLPPTTPLVFLDNDNQYHSDLAQYSQAPGGAFLGYDFDNTESTASSFMRCSPEGSVVEFVEKQRISNQVCTGVYGFASAAQFLKWGRYTLENGPFPKNECYMSSLYVNMIAGGEGVCAVSVPIVSLGTALHTASFTQSEACTSVRLRICFDLDGTLVTPPRVVGDLTTVSPIAPNVELARWAKAAGHYVIVHTSRTATPALGRITFDTLEGLGIPYDEVVFGKLCADIYVDSAAVNPYLQSVRALGLPFGDVHDAGLNAFNSAPSIKGVLARSDGRLALSGPSSSLRGLAFFYQQLPELACDKVTSLFPRFYSASDCPGDELELVIEQVKGVPMMSLFRAQLLEQYHLEIILASLDTLHSTKLPVSFSSGSSVSGLGDEYEVEFTSRTSDSSVFSELFDAPAVLAELKGDLSRYAPTSKVAPLVHGNCLFSNVIFTPTNRPFFQGMKGRVGGILTVSGDPLYDYAALCMSLIGYEELTMGIPSPSYEYRVKLLASFTSLLRSRGVSASQVLDIASANIAAQLESFIAFDELKDALWDLVRELRAPSKSQYTSLVKILRGV